MGILDKALDRIADSVAQRITGKSVTISSKDPTLKKIFGWGDEGETLNSPYSQLPIIYAAIRAVGKVIAQTDLVVMRGETEVGPNDPVRKLFDKPNLKQSPYEFKEGIGVNLQVKGNAFIVLSEEMARGLPLELTVWPSHYFKPAYDNDGNWLGWWVKRGKAPRFFLPPERVIHLGGSYNPNDELLSLAPLDVLKMTYSTMWDSLVYNRKFFQNDGTPPIIYKSNNGLSDRQREVLQKGLIDRRQGKDHAFKAQLVEGMDEVITLGFTQKDIQFLELIKQSEGDVLMVFGVTKTQVSKYEDVNYATALSQDKVFITNTCLPMMRQIESEINSQLLDSIGYKVRFDERSNEAMTYLSKEEADKAVAVLGARMVTLNEAREMIGLDPVDGGDEIPEAPAPSINFVQNPPGGKPPDPRMPNQPPAPPEPEAKDVSKALEMELAKARRTNTWHALNRIMAPIETRCVKSVRGYFHGVERKLEAKVGKSLAKAADRMNLEDAFDDGKLYKLMEGYLSEGVSAGAGTMNVQINLDDPGMKQYLANRVQYMKGINDTAKAQIQEKLDKLLQQAMDEAWTEQQRTEAIRTMLRDEFKSLASHARTIARTEVHGAFSEGRWDAVKELEPSKIEWVSSRDPLVRDSHAALDGDTVKPGESFSNGCRYPLDPLGSAGETINCRCTFSLHFGT